VNLECNLHLAGRPDGTSSTSGEADSPVDEGGLRLFVAGLSYKSAPVQLREKLAVHASRLGASGERLKAGGGLAEVVLLSTCNRVEIYGATAKINGNVHRLFELLTETQIDLSPYLYVKEGAEAVQHLFAVTSGLDSMVVGETEITGQVKQAYQAAQGAKLTGRLTNRLFQTALRTAKEIRTQTNIGRGSTSVGSVAVDLAERIFDHDLSGKTVMIIGAGRMGEACVRHLAKKGVRSILVANRAYERAENLASEFGGQAVRFDDRLEALAQADIVVSSTGAPETILHRDDVASVMPSRRNRPLFLIDIAVPRDIDADVQQLENVYLYNVDHLEAIVRENVRHREQELARCRGIIGAHTAELMTRLMPVPEKAFNRTVRPEVVWILAGTAPCPN
jgi:glutamyl-tRNA reductase